MENKNKNFGLGLSVIASIFFIFGFVTSLNNILIPKLQQVFDLSNFMAQLVNGAFFVTYFFFSIPSGGIIRRTGYKNAIIIGLLLIGLGGVIFYPAASMLSYPMFLIAIFILAIGVVFLQTAANPYVAILGSPDTASGRLNLTQALNSIAVTIAPMIGSWAFFRNVSENIDQVAQAESVRGPFLIVAVVVIVVAIIIKLIKLPEIEEEDTGDKKSVWKYPHVLLGAVAIFTYVGAEVASASFIVQYIGELQLNIDSATAATYVAIYWGGAMIGRLFGAIMLSNLPRNKVLTFSLIVLAFAFLAGWFITESLTLAAVFLAISFVNFLMMQLGRNNTNRVLAVFAIVASALLIFTVVSDGVSAIWAVCSIGFFNSVMFPNIFALGVKGLDSHEMASASGIINTLIVGGALIPMLMGVIADGTSIQLAYLLPLVCYLYIFFYAVKGSKIGTS